VKPALEDNPALVVRMRQARLLAAELQYPAIGALLQIGADALEHTHEIALSAPTELTPFVIEVQTERFVDAMLALQEAGFTVDGKPGHAARYVLRDAERCCEQGAAAGFVGTPCPECRADFGSIPE
jgi:hypothetical protein